MFERLKYPRTKYNTTEGKNFLNKTHNKKKLLKFKISVQKIILKTTLKKATNWENIFKKHITDDYYSEFKRTLHGNDAQTTQWTLGRNE